MKSFPTKWIGQERYHKESLDSTNAFLNTLAKENAVEGTLVSADVQTAGKGRRGRSWEAESGTSLLFSVLLRPKCQPDIAPQLTPLMAMAVTKVIREHCGLEAKIKWPNDVVINSKKVCGILTEMELKGSEIDHVIIGTGINLNQTKLPLELCGRATSLLLEKREAQNTSATLQETLLGQLGDSNADFNKEEILGRVLEAFEAYYETFLQTESFSEFVKKYNEWLVSRDKQVKVLDPKGEFTGISRGINEKGELLVELPNGEMIAVYAGEVSVRGLYGYV